jgi:CobQ-like glutamine amidotransferase family enzyme
MAIDEPRFLRLAHLYPSMMNLDGDRGNVICLRRRCEARGIHLDVDEIDIGMPLDPDRYDLVFMGGGQDREQIRVGEDLLRLKGPPLVSAVESGLPLLAVCGGYQMMGHGYHTAAGERIAGLGIFDAETENPGEGADRCIGNVQVAWEAGTLVGFENHGGRTYLGAGAVPLGVVRFGFGNNGEDGTEGCHHGNAFGTYLHGSLLPKNPALADRLLALSLERKYGSGELAPLDDRIEEAAHGAAAAVARQEATRISARLGSRWRRIVRRAGTSIGRRGQS